MSIWKTAQAVLRCTGWFCQHLNSDLRLNKPENNHQNDNCPYHGKHAGGEDKPPHKV
ncbi:Rieske 2Fe-2S domain-containing protein [Rosistilla carotiformis]|uniref:Rieske 2Fe-2S domain-containing protein n=1 Tax=Rosistilla carotiformis TaxID=2528017 RepID=UPI003704373C